MDGDNLVNLPTPDVLRKKVFQLHQKHFKLKRILSSGSRDALMVKKISDEIKKIKLDINQVYSTLVSFHEFLFVYLLVFWVRLFVVYLIYACLFLSAVCFVVWLVVVIVVFITVGSSSAFVHLFL